MAFDYQLAAHQFEEIGKEKLRLLAPSCAAVEDERPLLKRTALSMGLTPATFMLAVVEGERGSITGQIAAQMAIAAIGEKAQEICAAPGAQGRVPAPDVVRDVFREANRQVYQYAHRMQAGGQVGATGFVCAFDGECFAAAKVGVYEHYLWRNRELIRLHRQSSDAETQSAAGTLQRFIGANSQILVDFASVTLRDGDCLLVTTLGVGEEFEHVIRDVLSRTMDTEEISRQLCTRALPSNLAKGAGAAWVLRRNLFFAVMQVGRPVIALTNVIDS